MGHRDEVILFVSVLDTKDETVEVGPEVITVGSDRPPLEKEGSRETTTGGARETEDAEARASAVGLADTAPLVAHGEVLGTLQGTDRHREVPVAVVEVM